MQYPFIRCYNPNFPIPPYCFFMLCKGENAGKPSFKPWPNSFMIICPDEYYYDFYFWLFYGLWHTGSFKVRHHGSVIPFINIPDVRDILREVVPPIYKDWKRYKEILALCESLEQRKANLAEQIIATKDLQSALLRKYLGGFKKGKQ